MPAKKLESEVIKFPGAGKKASSTEKIWGKAVYSHGYAGIPSILIQGQRRLGLNSMQMNICVQLLDYWFDPTRKTGEVGLDALDIVLPASEFDLRPRLVVIVEKRSQRAPGPLRLCDAG